MRAVLSIVLMLAVAGVGSRACPMGCKCMEEGEEMKCHLPWAREIPTRFFSKFGGLKKLDLSDNNILNIQPNSLSSLPNLEELILSGNKIYFLENDAFKGSPKLRKICLEDNNIHFIEDEVFEDLEQLEELTLSKNKISELPDFSNNKNLRSLCLTSNQIDEIEDDAFKNNQQLEKLSLKRNKLSELPRDAFAANVSSFTSVNLVGNSLRDLPEVIREMENLESLSLCFNPIKIFKSGDFANLVNLKNLSMTSVGLTEIQDGVFPQSLERLWIGHNKITGEKLEKMHFPKLVELDLSHNEIDSLPKESFEGVPNLIKLDLSDSQISSNEEKAFSPLTKLECLDLSENRLGYIPSFPHNQDLKKLNLNENQIPSSASLLASSLPNLIELRLSNNDLGNFKPAIFPASLELLDLSHNHLSGITEFSDGKLQALKTLNVSHNNIENLHTEDFSGFPLLETLNLRSNNITSLPQFANATYLKELLLCHNEIGELHPGNMSSFQQLEVITADRNNIKEITDETFHHNTHLKRISLNKNEIEKISTDAFAEQESLEELWLLFNELKAPPNIKSNKQLRVIGLCNNPIGNLAKRALVGPDGIEVVLLRSMGLTELSADVFGPTHSIKVLNLALENSLTSIPSAVRNMPELRVLKLNGNPIKDVSAAELVGLNNLREIRFNDMKLEDFDVTSLFPRLPALRTLYLAENPWRCDCDTKWYTLGIDGARARVETEDRDEVICASPKRLKGKRFDFLRLGDFQHCAPGTVGKVKSSSAVINLPYIGAFAKDYEEAFHSVTYVPVGGGSLKKQTAGKRSTEAQLHGLTPGTEYFVCTSIMTVNLHDNASHTHQERENCFMIKTENRQPTDDDEERMNSTGSIAVKSRRDLLIVYAVLGSALGFVLITSMIIFYVWCRRSRTDLREQLANVSEISDGAVHERSNGEFGAQSTPQKGGTNGRQMVMHGRPDGGHVNEGCDVLNEGGKSARTKL